MANVLGNQIKLRFGSRFSHTLMATIYSGHNPNTKESFETFSATITPSVSDGQLIRTN